ncbi:MAG: malto-oligosyltrehalose synthase, partial [Terriglobia bacterium]
LLVPYLHELGISELYGSPRFKARRGSSHGYDVADPCRVNSELGTETDFDELVKRLRDYGMGFLLDIVPNHMSASSDNPWWMDVLENGSSSAYANYFDLFRHTLVAGCAGEPDAIAPGKILLPILSDHYGRVLERQELQLKLDEKGLFVRYGDNRLPLDPATWAPVIDRAVAEVTADNAAARDCLVRLLKQINLLPPRTPRDTARRGERSRTSQDVKSSLWNLVQQQSEIRSAVEKAMLAFNGVQGIAESFDPLARLLSEQAYRLVFWKVATEEISYRRFFDVSDLVGLRVELPEVFQSRHAATLELIKEGRVTGLRVDHIDGLRDPLEYLERMQQAIRNVIPGKGGDERFFMVVEKISAEREDLPAGWPVCGTTGYDFMNLINQVLIDPRGLKKVREFYAHFTGSHQTFSDVVYQADKLVLEDLLGADINTLARELSRLAAADRYAQDVTFSQHKRALVEVSACLPVYRTYIRDARISARDQKQIALALKEARRRTAPDAMGLAAALDFLERVLLLDAGNQSGEARRAWLSFAMRWQQFTGAGTAKGVEDTALYRYSALLSLNEVGGNPGAGGKTPGEFHETLLARCRQTPLTLNATSTHDTKRSEDVRARIAVISEFPVEWKARVTKWSRLNRSRAGRVDGQPAPDRNDEVFLYQTLLGCWPFSAEEAPDLSARLKEYVIKALREAKFHSGWQQPNLSYEDAVIQFVEALLNLPPEDAFSKDFLAFQSKIAFYGALNSISQTVLKAMSPGVPDFFQGMELWNFSLVDPDNRRPVDFAARTQMLDGLRQDEARDQLGLARRLVSEWKDGRIKMYVTRKSLEIRKSLFEVFAEGDYIPLLASGPKQDHVLSFARTHDGAWVVVAVPRLMARITPSDLPPAGARAWGRRSAIQLPGEAPLKWRNIFTGERLRGVRRGGGCSLSLAKLFAFFPVSVLVEE